MGQAIKAFKIIGLRTNTAIPAYSITPYQKRRSGCQKQLMLAELQAEIQDYSRVLQ